MKTNLILLLLVVILALWIKVEVKQNQKLTRNQSALLSQAKFYKTRDSLNAASIEKLTLTTAQFREKQVESTKLIKSMSLKLRRVESVSTQAVETTRLITDTLIVRDSMMGINYTDPYLSIKGQVSIHPQMQAHLHSQAVLKAEIISYDTLIQVVHRVPRKFWFLRFGTKAIRQEIVSKNPYTKITYAEYVELD